MSVPKLELARYPALFSERQAFLDPLMIGEKKHELSVAGLVLDKDFIRRFGAWRRRPEFGDDCLDRDHAIEWRRADFRPAAPVDRRRGQMKNEIDHAGAIALASQEPVEELARFRPYARQGRGRSEKRVEKRRAHWNRESARRCRRNYMGAAAAAIDAVSNLRGAVSAISHKLRSTRPVEPVGRTSGYCTASVDMPKLWGGLNCVRMTP